MTIEELVKGTFLEKIFKIAEKGEFNEWYENVKPLSEGEESIGDLNNLEKACIDFFDCKNTEAVEMLDSGIPPGDKRLECALDLAYGSLNLLETLLHEKFKGKPIEIRQGWKVVELKKGPCNCPACLLKRISSNIVVLNLGNLDFSRGLSKVLH